MKETGFTLLECLLVLTLVGLLSFLGSNAWVTLRDHLREDIVADTWRHRILLARLLALQSGESVSLCPSVDGLTCGGQWHEGQIIQGRGTLQGHSYEKPVLLSVFPSLPSKEKFTFYGYPQSHVLTFEPWGLLKQQNGTFVWQREKREVRIIVSKSGRVRIEKRGT